MSLAHGILGFLSYTSMTGYDLTKAFDSSVRFFWYAQSSHIYLKLNKLEKKGLISCEYIIQQARPNKKLYSITPAGKEEFLKWIAQESADDYKTKDEFLMRIFFSGNRTITENIRMLEGFIKDCEKFKERMNTVPESIAHYREAVSDIQSVYWEFTADFGYRRTIMCIDWAKACIKRLKNIAEKEKTNEDTTD